MDMHTDIVALLTDIEEGVFRGETNRIEEILVRVVKQTDISPRALMDALIRGVERASQSLQSAEFSVPGFLFAVDAFRAGARRIKQAGCEFPEQDRCVLIGIVEGEVHNLGKNIVAAVLESSGYHVINMDQEMSRDLVIEAIRQYQPSIVALSAMMSTCITAMQDTIAWVRKLHPDVKIMVGGAALDSELAASIGADGYAESAATAADEARRMFSAS